MSTENNENVVADTAVTAPEVTFAEETLLPNTNEVADAIQKARAQEKAKLYPQMEKLQEELSLLKRDKEEREAKEAERKAQRAQRDAELAKQKKAEEEQALELRDLLTKKEQEWQSQLEAERLEREKAFALLERERQFQELQQYRQQRLEQERENIIPELIDLISGDSRDEIEQSIAGLKERSSKIFDSVAAASQQTRKEMVGTRVTVPASGPLDNDSDSRMYSADDLSKMSMADYAKNRSKLLGTSNTRGQGLFGN
jgi:hypothetical protein